MATAFPTRGSPRNTRWAREVQADARSAFSITISLEASTVGHGHGDGRSNGSR